MSIVEGEIEIRIIGKNMVDLEKFGKAVTKLLTFDHDEIRDFKINTFKRCPDCVANGSPHCDIYGEYDADTDEWSYSCEHCHSEYQKTDEGLLIYYF
jgi:predicted secreted protein